MCCRLHFYPTKVISLLCWIDAVFWPSRCAFGFHCWDDYQGVKNRPIEGTCDSLLSSYFVSIWWNGKFTITSCWSSLLGASTGWIPLAWKHGYFYSWIASWIGCYGAHNSNCLLKPFVTTLNIYYYFKTIINSNFFWSTCCFIVKNKNTNL
jgi:hypothetical protein